MDATQLHLSVADDGEGFAGPPAGGVHDGLGNMTRRADALGGHLVIDSEPGRGTRVTLDVPLPAGLPRIGRVREA
jgi:signal transduction histidine kinase